MSIECPKSGDRVEAFPIHTCKTVDTKGRRIKEFTVDAETAEKLSKRELMEKFCLAALEDVQSV